MKLDVLGASGGIADARHTTSFLLDKSTLLDAGTGVGKLSVAELCAIDRVLITHPHMDHICGLALMLASVIGTRTGPIELIAPTTVIQDLKNHIFNWSIWPDFSQLPSEDQPVLAFRELNPGESLDLLPGLSAEVVELSHTVPSFAYLLESSETGRSLCFCGDTAQTDHLWTRINQRDGVDQLFIELSYPDSKRSDAEVSGHHCLSTLFEDLVKLERPGQIALMHHKPGYASAIREAVRAQGLHERFDLMFIDEGMQLEVL